VGVRAVKGYDDHLDNYGDPGPSGELTPDYLPAGEEEAWRDEPDYEALGEPLDWEKDLTAPIPQFVILYDTGELHLASGTDVSTMYDLADCDLMDGVKAILAVDEDGDLVPVTTGKQEFATAGDEAENSLVWAYTPIMAGTRRVGTIAHTDH
jgi:hypothetical protein